jgi:hypothetical protein
LVYKKKAVFPRKFEKIAENCDITSTPGIGFRLGRSASAARPPFVLQLPTADPAFQGVPRNFEAVTGGDLGFFGGLGLE